MLANIIRRPNGSMLSCEPAPPSILAYMAAVAHPAERLQAGVHIMMMMSTEVDECEEFVSRGFAHASLAIMRAALAELEAAVPPLISRENADSVRDILDRYEAATATETARLSAEQGCALQMYRG